MAKQWFHLACPNGQSKVVEMLIRKSIEFKIELITKDKYGKTGFQYARLMKNDLIVNVIGSKMPSIKKIFY